MEDFNSDEWVKKTRNGRTYYDRKSICVPLPKFDVEEEIFQHFCENFVFADAIKFKQQEEEFLKTLSSQQKEMYQQILEKLRDFQKEREQKLITYSRDWGRIVFD